MAVWNPSDYSRNSSQQQSWARELIGKLELKGDENVLDIGCGDGKVTAEIEMHLSRGSIVGVDSSKAMIDFARSAHSCGRYGNLYFFVKDASCLDFSKEFDLVFSNATLHWIWDHKPVLAGIDRALKPGGRMVAQMGGKDCAAEVCMTMEEMMESPRWQDSFQNFAFRFGFHGPSEYRQWLTEVGFTPIRVDHFLKDMTHAGPEGLAGWLRTTWMPWVHSVPQQDRDEFMSELVERYLKRMPLDSSGLAHVRMMRLEVEATRPT